MSRFWAGFGVASLIWIGAASAVYLSGVLPLAPEPEPIAQVPEVAPDSIEVSDVPVRGRRNRRMRVPGARRAETPMGNATTGDDLHENDMRTVDMQGGGEQQLSGPQIDNAFDSAMGRIRRCLVLIAGDDPVQGTVTFGMRIGSDGHVRAVRLSGPAAATTGDAGACLQSAARTIVFPTFDGPEMLVHYPLTLE